MSNIYKYAQNYIAAGFSVIPLQRNGKKPVVGWQQYQQQYPDAHDIQTWFSPPNPFNIGIVTGILSNLLVVDVDKAEGWTFLKRQGTGNPSIASTGKGMHLYYQYPDVKITIGARIGQPEHGIDFRGEGGYVVAPPSMHNNGTQYEWVYTDYPPSLPPDWLVRTLHKHNGCSRQEKSEQLEKIMQGVPHGNRNESAARLTGLLLRRFPKKEWNWCWELLQGWNQNNNPPLPNDELEKVFQSIYRYHKGDN